MEDTEKVFLNSAHNLLEEDAVHVLKHAKSTIAASCGNQMDTASGPAAPAGMTGAALVLGGGMTGDTKRAK